MRVFRDRGGKPRQAAQGDTSRPRNALRRLSPQDALRWKGLAVLLILASTGIARADAPLPVAVVTARVQPAILRVDLTGTIVAAESVPVGFRTGGRILEMHAEVGDSVAAGAILASVEPTQAEAAARAAAAQLTAAEAGATQAQLARDRAAGLLERGAGTRADLDAAEQALLAAGAARDQAMTQVAKANQAVEDTVIRAPVAGIVTLRSGEPGQIAAAAQSVLTIAPDGRREALFYAPNVPDLDQFIDRAVTLHPVDAPATALTATVTEISPLATAATGTVLVRARLEGAAANTGLGLPVVTAIELAEAPSIRLPWTALATDGGKPAVWTVDPATQTVALTPVTVARYSADTVGIAEGLTDGDLVVAAGSNLLYPGRKVEAIEAAE